MGCGSSRLEDNNGTGLGAKLARPLLLNRLEEFKKRRQSHGLKDNTPSKKELLMDAKENEEDHSQKTDLHFPNRTGKDSYLHDETGSCVTSEGSKGGSPDSPTKGESNKVESSKKDVQLKDEKSREIGNLGETEGRKVVEPLVKDHEAKVVVDGDANRKVEDEEFHDVDDHDDNDDDDDDNDGRMIRHHDQDDLLFPGSPSFRVYFVDEPKDNKEEGVDDHLPVPDVAPTNVDRIPSKELPVAEEVQKRKKRRSFKRVLPTTKQAKNMFNVRTCMSSNSNHDRTHLLTAKPHA